MQPLEQLLPRLTLSQQGPVHQIKGSAFFGCWFKLVARASKQHHDLSQQVFRKKFQNLSNAALDNCPPAALP